MASATYTLKCRSLTKEWARSQTNIGRVYVLADREITTFSSSSLFKIACTTLKLWKQNVVVSISWNGIWTMPELTHNFRRLSETDMSYHFANPGDIFRFQHHESSKAVSFGALFWVYKFYSQKFYMAMLFAEYSAAFLSNGDLMVQGTRIWGDAMKTLTSSSGWVYRCFKLQSFSFVRFDHRTFYDQLRQGWYKINMGRQSPLRKRICWSNSECVSASLNIQSKHVHANTERVLLFHCFMIFHILFGNTYEVMSEFFREKF